MAPKVSQTGRGRGRGVVGARVSQTAAGRGRRGGVGARVSQTAAGRGVGVGAPPRLFKKKARIIAAYHLGRSLKENKTFAQLQEIPSVFSIHGLFGKKISKKFKGPKWDPTILSESFKFCLRERWPNCAPNDEKTDPQKHLRHHNEHWKKEYDKHFPDLKMSQPEYLVFTLNRFNSVRSKLNHALNLSCEAPIDKSGRRQININKFLKKLSEHGLFPSVHSRIIEELKIELLTEVRFYFDPETKSPILPPSYTKKVEGHYDLSKGNPLFVA